MQPEKIRQLSFKIIKYLNEKGIELSKMESGKINLILIDAFRTPIEPEEYATIRIVDQLKNKPKIDTTQEKFITDIKTMIKTEINK